MHSYLSFQHTMAAGYPIPGSYPPDLEAAPPDQPLLAEAQGPTSPEQRPGGYHYGQRSFKDVAFLVCGMLRMVQPQFFG
jgi:hypothetical protein